MAFTASDLAALRAMTVEFTSLAVLEHVRMIQYTPLGSSRQPLESTRITGTLVVKYLYTFLPPTDRSKQRIGRIYLCFQWNIVMSAYWTTLS